ncbi:hypothetical protein NM208_g12582 [Fusarium decemcellulare]|uniref:Uncharacterized protein n=1 Tax=Fusarium decemcellulare TaxID=57161 RepID=A0ACC1RQM6_9HYPO|nr:hypothetical protein NM208_g12582 [Fusarium decemcellulare]
MLGKGLETNKTVQILRAAAVGKYGVLAAIAYNVEHILGFVKAAERRHSPLIIQLFPWAVTYSNGVLVHAASQAAKQANVPISVHLDHCQDEDLIKSACDLPFDSIMVDMSHYSKVDNLARTKQLVAYCHAKGKATEAEPGRIEGGEDGILDTADLSGLMTTYEETRAFIDIGVDFLAPAFGNVHGEYGPRGIALEWDRLVWRAWRSFHKALDGPAYGLHRLERIHEVANDSGVFVVLHGVNNFPADLFHKLIAVGITKINVNRDILSPYYKHLGERCNKVPFTQLLEECVEVVANSMAYHMDIVLSSGKA